jgi:hypothetical protein
MQIQDLTNTQDMEPKSIDLTFIIMKNNNLIQSGCISGITSDGYKMSCYKVDAYELLKNALDKTKQSSKGWIYNKGQIQ